MKQFILQHAIGDLTITRYNFKGIKSSSSTRIFKLIVEDIEPEVKALEK